MIPLNELPCGARAVVRALRLEGPMRRRLMDVGFLPGAEVRALYRSCTGDPTAYRVRGAVIALRREDAAAVLAEPISEQVKEARPWD